MIHYWTLADLSAPDERTAPGGTCTLYVVRVRDVATMPRHIPGQAADNPLLLKDDTTYYTYKLDSDSIRLEESTVDSKQGRYARITIRGFRTGLTVDHQAEVEKLRPGYYLVLWESNEGWRRLLGTPTRPLIFSSTGDSGAADQDDIGHSWQFEGVQHGPSCYMSEILPLPDIINTQCGIITMDDFTLSPWQVNTSNELVGIHVNASPTGDIASINGYTTGEVLRPNGSVLAYVQYSPVYGYYVPTFPLTPITLDPGTYTVVIPNLPVTVAGAGHTCSVNFVQEFTMPGGSFDDSFGDGFDTT